MDSKYLTKLGLTEKEAGVYLASLELGSASVAEIGAKAKINRTTAYDILEYLAHYGIVSHVGDTKTKHYIAEPPESLVAYLDKKSKEFEQRAKAVKEILPELKGVYNSIPRKPKVRFYDGDEGIIAMYEDSLTAKTEILSWLDTSKTYGFSAKYFEDYYKRRAAKKIHIKAIVDDSPLSRELIKRDKAEDRDSRLISKEKIAIEPECYIYENKVSFMSLREKFGVIIESQDIAEAQRKLYALAWDRAKELDKKVRKG